MVTVVGFIVKAKGWGQPSEHSVLPLFLNHFSLAGVFPSNFGSRFSGQDFQVKIFRSAISGQDFRVKIFGKPD